MKTMIIVAAIGGLATGCSSGAFSANSAPGGESGAPTGGAGGDNAASGGAGGLSGGALAMLSYVEAPAADRAFFWGTIDVSAPGFAGPPRDEMTIGLGPDNRLRYASWKTLPMLAKTFGEAVSDFPLSGSRTVDLRPGINYDYTSTVLDSPAPTANHFLLRYRVVSVQGGCDYVESIEGTRAGDGWAVVYTDDGKLYGATIAARGQGTLFPGDPAAPPPVAGQPSLWSAPVELTAPGFYGPPVDHLTVALDGGGHIRWFSFQNFVRRLSFGSDTQGMEPGSATIAEEGTTAFDGVVPATPAHFVIRYQVRSTSKLNDYVEGVDGTREAGGLVIRYFLSGTLWGATIDAHAAGRLVPARPSANPGVGGSGGAPTGGATGAGGYAF